MAKRKLIQYEDYELIDMWNKFIYHVTLMEPELFRNSTGNIKAGIRFRKAAVQARKLLLEIRNRMVKNDRDRRIARKKYNKENKK